MNDSITTGSVLTGPFEETKVSVYMMAVGLAEASFVNTLVDDPNKIEILCAYLFSDPRFKESKNLPN